MNTQRSEELLQRALKLFPGGVNSPVRAYQAVGGKPPFIARGERALVFDVDDNPFIDYVGSWGPMILGHAHPQVVEAVQSAAQRGLSFGAPHQLELELAERVLEAYPACEMIRFVSSGTEATMSALRLARGFTGRDLIVKFRGNYHGHADGLLVEAGSGLLATGGTAGSAPSSAGVPQAFADLTLVAEYNDPSSIEQLFSLHPRSIAAVIFEPVVGNTGVIPPSPAFLEALHTITRQHGALLIADEVMTGFRLAKGGAVERYGLKPDLVTWGKIIGGGLPVGAYGGTGALMQQVAPSGPVYQAGTLSGNPVAMAAGLATLRLLSEHPPYAQLEAYGQELESGLRIAAERAGVAININRVGSMITVFFSKTPVTSYNTAVSSNRKAFSHFFHALLDHGVYWPPSPFEAAFISAAHGQKELAITLAAAETAMAAAATAGNGS